MIYPPACMFCGELLEKEERHVCGDCRWKIAYPSEPCCLRCGKEIDSEDKEYCQDCNDHQRTFIKGFPAIHYREPVTDGVAAFKYSNKKGYGAFFAGEIVKRYGGAFLDIAPQVLVPVPIHKSKLRKRGYNQAEVLAIELSRLTGIPVDNSLVERRVKTLPQKELNDLARERNIKNAFFSTGKIVQYKSALIVDDIYTTGATVEACTKVLHSMGVEDVYYTSICIGKGY